MSTKISYMIIDVTAFAKEIFINFRIIQIIQRKKRQNNKFQQSTFVIKTKCLNFVYMIYMLNVEHFRT